MDAVEVDGVRVRGAVVERDPQPLAFAAAQRRPRDPPVVGPGGELDARHDLDLFVDRVEHPRAHDAPGCGPRRRPPVEVTHDLVRIEPVGHVVDGDAAAEVRVTPVGCVPCWCCSAECPPAREAPSSAPPAIPAPINPRRVSDATRRIVTHLTSYRATAMLAASAVLVASAAIFHGTPAQNAPWFVSLERGGPFCGGVADRARPRAHRRSLRPGRGPERLPAARRRPPARRARRLLPHQLPDHPVAGRAERARAPRPRSTTSR